MFLFPHGFYILSRAVPFYICRFIPNRTTSDFDLASYVMNKHEGGEAASPTKLEYQKQLSAAMKVPDDLKVLSFKENKPKPAEGKVYT